MGTLVKKVRINISSENGKKYDDYNFLNISLNQHLLQPNELRFTMQKKDWRQSTEDVTFPTPRDLMGANVFFQVKTERFDDKDNLDDEARSLIFKGIIFNVNIYTSSDTFSEQLIDVVAYTPDYLLMDHPHCYSYEKKTLADIVNATLDSYVIPKDVSPWFTDSIPYTVQYNESNYQFLRRLAQRYGQWMYSDGSKLIFGEIKVTDIIKLQARNDILNYHFHTALVHHTSKYANHEYLFGLNNVISDKNIPELRETGHHELADETFKKSEKLFTKETFHTLQCDNPEESPKVALHAAKVQLLGEKKQQVVCSGSSVRSDLRIGSRIEICDHFYSGNDIKFLNYKRLVIIGITHYTEIDGNYRNSFTAVTGGDGYPPYYQSNVFPVSGAQRAVVKDNKDLEKIGRVRVQFLWQKEQNANLMTPWIRIAQPHGGHDKGFYFIPEIDEEVMVDFEYGNAEKPFVVGTLYNIYEMPGFGKWPTDSNEIKAIRTKNGHTIEIHDEGADGYIRIYDHQKENYILTFSTDKKLIKMESTGNIELHAKGNIVMNAGGDIVSNAGHDINDKAGNQRYVEVGADDFLDVNGGRAILIQGNKNETVKAQYNLNTGSVTMKAGSNIESDATGLNIIKGAMVEIN